MARRTLGIVKTANSSNGKKGTVKKIDETPLGGGMACQQKTGRDISSCAELSLEREKEEWRRQIRGWGRRQTQVAVLEMAIFLPIIENDIVVIFAAASSAANPWRTAADTIGLAARKVQRMGKQALSGARLVRGSFLWSLSHRKRSWLVNKKKESKRIKKGKKE